MFLWLSGINGGLFVLGKLAAVVTGSIPVVVFLFLIDCPPHSVGSITARVVIIIFNLLIIV